MIDTLPRPRGGGGDALRAERDRSLEGVMLLIGRAFTRGQAEEAKAAYRRHVERFPADEGAEAFHGLGNVLSEAEMREADSRRLGLTEEEHQERESLLERTNEAYRVDPASEAVWMLAQARLQLQMWLGAHPGDALVRSRLDTFTEYLRLAEEMHAVNA
jgi:hypothetical protein